MVKNKHIIFHNARAEHLLFQKAGLSVPVEAQAAFFSALAIWQRCREKPDDNRQR